MADGTILDHPDDLLRLSLFFLGIGHFAFIASVCSRFKTAYLANVSDDQLSMTDLFSTLLTLASSSILTRFPPFAGLFIAL